MIQVNKLKKNKKLIVFVMAQSQNKLRGPNMPDKLHIKNCRKKKNQTHAARAAHGLRS